MTPDRVLELRQYTLHEGQRDVLLDVFERELIETQEEVGLSVPGHFLDRDRPDRFVWLRGFADLTSRREGLAAFYGGPAWAAHKDVANPTMVDFDDVLLLRPLAPMPPPAAPRPEVATAPHTSLVVATVWHVQPGGAAAAAALVDPVLTSAGAPRLALLETEPAANDFPALPVREGVSVLVRLTRFETATAYDEHVAELDRLLEWQQAQQQLRSLLTGPVQELRLQPAGRSLLR